MKEVSKARVACGTISIFLLFYHIFVSLPDVIFAMNEYGSYFDPIKTVLPLVLQLGFYASIALWSLSGVLKLAESDN